jgi:L-asparaginase
MRSASAADYDGPANLTAAVRVAAAPGVGAADVGVVVVLDGSIEAADDVSKTHASSFDTFRSLNRGSLGRVTGAAVTLSVDRGRRRRVTTEGAAERVFLVTATVATDGTPIAALHGAGADGFVVAATGAGNTSASVLAAAERAIADGVPVVLATRCPAGAASAGYAFPGGGATWLRAGAMLAGHLTGEKARIALALGLGAGLDHDGLASLLADPSPIHDPDHYWEMR